MADCFACGPVTMTRISLPVEFSAPLKIITRLYAVSVSTNSADRS
jgi:hypothetical protein